MTLTPEFSGQLPSHDSSIPVVRTTGVYRHRLLKWVDLIQISNESGESDLKICFYALPLKYSFLCYLVLSVLVYFNLVRLTTIIH